MPQVVFMPTEFGDVNVRQALQDGNCQLASVLVTERLRDAGRLSPAELAALHCQAAAAAVSCGRLGDASEHIAHVREMDDLDAATAATAAILLAAVACCMADDSAALCEASDFVDAEIARNLAPAPFRVRMHLAGLRCSFALRRLDSARAHLDSLRTDSAAQVHWIESQVLIAVANLALLDGRVSDVKATLAQLMPVVTAMGPGVPAAATWWEVTEVANAAGLVEEAWEAATRAIDCSAVRPADRHGTFAPGVLMWAAGT